MLYRFSWSHSVVENDCDKSVLGCGGCNQSIMSHSRATIRVQNSWILCSVPCQQVCMYLLKSVPHIQTDMDSEKMIVYCGFTTHHSSHANPSIGYVMIKKPTAFLPGRQFIHALCNFSKASKSCSGSLTLFWKQNGAFFCCFLVAFPQKSGEEFEVRKSNSK